MAGLKLGHLHSVNCLSAQYTPRIPFEALRWVIGSTTT
jgi:hypothetical protein